MKPEASPPCRIEGNLEEAAIENSIFRLRAETRHHLWDGLLPGRLPCPQYPVRKVPGPAFDNTGFMV